MAFYYCKNYAIADYKMEFALWESNVWRNLASVALCKTFHSRALYWNDFRFQDIHHRQTPRTFSFEGCSNSESEIDNNVPVTEEGSIVLKNGVKYSFGYPSNTILLKQPIWHLSQCTKTYVSNVAY